MLRFVARHPRFKMASLSEWKRNSSLIISTTSNRTFSWAQRCRTVVDMVLKMWTNRQVRRPLQSKKVIQLSNFGTTTGSSENNVSSMLKSMIHHPLLKLVTQDLSHQLAVSTWPICKAGPSLNWRSNKCWWVISGQQPSGSIVLQRTRALHLQRRLFALLSMGSGRSINKD